MEIRLVLSLCLVLYAASQHGAAAETCHGCKGTRVTTVRASQYYWCTLEPDGSMYPPEEERECVRYVHQTRTVYSISPSYCPPGCGGCDGVEHEEPPCSGYTTTSRIETYKHKTRRSWWRSKYVIRYRIEYKCEPGKICCAGMTKVNENLCHFAGHH